MKLFAYGLVLLAILTGLLALELDFWLSFLISLVTLILAGLFAVERRKPEER